jgi:hypothetical protein
MSILVFVGSVLMVLSGLFMLALAMAGGFGTRNRSAVAGAAWGAFAGFLYLGLACLYIVPGVFLHRFAGALAQLKATGLSSALEDAMRHQKSFWRFVGVMSIVGIAGGVSLVALAVLAGVMSAIMSGQR